jgi:uncharacterized protein DUF3568
MRRLCLLAILTLVPLTSGCLAVAGLTVGAGVVGYVYYDKNEAHQDFSASFEKTWKATGAALRGLEYQAAKDAPHELDTGTIMVGDVKVKVARQPGGKTRVSVRVGTFHTEEHRRRAGLILEKIESEL